MENFDTTRFNIYWFLWLLAPVVIMFSAAYIKRRKITIAAVILSLLLTYTLSNITVSEKWDKRLQNAITQEQLEAATTDGANKVFTLYFIAPLEAIFFTWLWYWVGGIILKLYNKSSNLTGANDAPPS